MPSNFKRWDGREPWTFVRSWSWMKMGRAFRTHRRPLMNALGISYWIYWEILCSGEGFPRGTWRLPDRGIALPIR